MWIGDGGCAVGFKPQHDGCILVVLITDSIEHRNVELTLVPLRDRACVRHCCRARCFSSGIYSFESGLGSYTFAVISIFFAVSKTLSTTMECSLTKRSSVSI